jgi:hypothetical protein
MTVSNGLAVGLGRDDRRRSRRDDDFGRRIMLAGGRLSVNHLAVIGVVGNDAGDPSFYCRQQSQNLCDVACILICQDVRHDFTRFGIDS